MAPPRLATLHCTVLFTLLVSAAQAETFKLQSPNERLTISVDVTQTVNWSAKLDDAAVIAPSNIGLTLKGLGDITRDTKLISVDRNEVNSSHTPAVKHKSAMITEHYRELSLRFDNDFGIDFRAYNDGVAYRFVGEHNNSVTVEDETMGLNFPAGATTLFPEEESLISHYERLYVPSKVADISPGRFASLPAYIGVNDINIVFTEADLYDYPGLFLYGTGKDGFSAGFSNVVAEATPMAGSKDRNQLLSYTDYIAKTQGHRHYPWRVAVISDNDGALVESQLVWLLSRKNQLTDSSWIKPGRIAWDWYNANNLFDVDFKSGINTQTYKYYIDFAAEYGLEYVILDEGWTKTTSDLITMNPEVDVHELVRYGQSKNVEIILWALWGPLDQDYQNILKTYGEWGVAGIKTDFMQRSDQEMVNFYEKIAREAAKHELLVDYHGGFKPAGLRRAYPNVMSYEGVKGNENNKWSADITPEHNVTLPFIRMVAGPMDFTPGALRNAHLANHHISHYRPVSLGTRAHQVAMYAVYESALQMLCESPSTYRREPKVTEFISQFPADWDETHVLDAQVADYILVARRKGDNWYLGAMTDNTARTLSIDFSFLGEGKFTLTALGDGKNTEHFAEDYTITTQALQANDQLTIKLASGGGWAGVIKAAQ
ncbi:glycoside hydrolase family 97 protein [Gilvimarinus polysaccharolyticus]|uniref:glycoside hydrolase family 97 protein n=1 Tax=Gilvimarinus polysaccharolyticus TaxID=863921 RepID=UPI000673B6C2|nr:glycoside hydrolase family 97 protein [Gilvimarinus polysaccharolyticus]